MDFEIIFAGDRILSLASFIFPRSEFSSSFLSMLSDKGLEGTYSRKKQRSEYIYIYIYCISFVIFPSRYALYAVAQTNEYFIGKEGVEKAREELAAQRRIIDFNRSAEEGASSQRVFQRNRI